MPGNGEHLLAEVHTGNSASLPGQFHHHVAGAASHVQSGKWTVGRGKLADGVAAPAAVEAEGHDAVEAVVVARYLVEIIGHSEPR